MNIGLVALRFLAGSVIGVAGLYATLAGGGLAALIIPVTSFFLGGAVAGSGLRLGRRGALGFGVAFVLADVPAVLSVVATQAMPGPAMAAALVFFYGILFAVVFGIAGIVGLGIGGVADGTVLRGAAVGCCGGGMAGGLVFGIVLVQNLAGNAGRGTLQVAVGLGLTLPWLLGGTAIARALSARPDAKPAEESGSGRSGHPTR